MYDQAPRPSPGPHKLRESLPLTIFLRNRLKYALTGREVTSIVKQRLIKIDGKVRTDTTYPAGFMGVFKTIYLHDEKKVDFRKFSSDVITIEKSGEHFRLLYDVKGRFTIHRITAEEATYKLLKVRRVAIGNGGVPHIVTHGGQMDAQFVTLILILKPTIPSNMISIRQDLHFRHRRRHQALDILTQGQGYQAYYFRGEKCQEKKSCGAVTSLKESLVFFSSMLCMSLPHMT